MRILYAIQGTGNGHISRARAIIPALQKHGVVDILVSGMQAEVVLDYPVKYRCGGLGFIFGKKGGIDLMATYRKAKLRRFKKEVNELPVEDYNLVLSDFEPVSAWACLQKGKPCIGLSHQSAVLNPKAPQPEHKDKVGAAFLNYYAPVTRHYGFHFQRYDEGIFTPVIRQGVRIITPSDAGHYTVYLPAYSDERIIETLLHFPEAHWEVFSKHASTNIEQQNILVRPIHDNLFLQSMASSKGILCGAGFETPAEALFLGKKLMVIPMKGQFEQQCNAAALEHMGVTVIGSLKPKHISKIDHWLEEGEVISVNYPDETQEIVDRVIRDYNILQSGPPDAETPHGGRFRRRAFQKVVAAYISH